MKLGRYKDHDWQSGYDFSRSRLRGMISVKAPSALVAHEAQHMLKNYYRGPWRMLAMMTLRELFSVWNHYGWHRWNWIRVNVFRRPQDPTLAAYEQIVREEEALNESEA